MEDPVVPPEWNRYGHPLAGLVVRTIISRSFIQTWMAKKYRTGNVYLFSGNKNYSCR